MHAEQERISKSEGLTLVPQLEVATSRPNECPSNDGHLWPAPITEMQQWNGSGSGEARQPSGPDQLAEDDRRDDQQQRLVRGTPKDEEKKKRNECPFKNR